MTPEQARARLTLALQPSAAPALSTEELDALVEIAVGEGLRAAMYEGLNAKYSKVVGQFDVKSSAGDEAKRSQVAAALKAARDSWAIGGANDPAAQQAIQTGGKGISTLSIRRST